MSRSVVTRSIAVILSVVVVMAFSLMPGEQTYAASKKTIYQVVESTYINKTSSGYVSKTHSKLTYDKNGLLKQIKSTSNEGSRKSVIKRNKKGAATRITDYEGKKVYSITKNTVNKKGLVTKSKEYVVKDGKKTLDNVTKITYYSNRKMKKSTTESTDGKIKYSYYYRKNGTLKKNESVFGDSKDTMTCDKKGNPLKRVYSFGSGDYYTTGTATYKNKYNKKGDLVKSVQTDKFKTGEGTDTKVITSTYTYKYDKHGNILKEKSKNVTVYSDGEKFVDTFTGEYKYKKFKVDKKYLHIISPHA